MESEKLPADALTIRHHICGNGWKIILPVLTATIMILTSCKSGGNDPKMVITTFLDAISKKDFATVKKLTTNNSQGMIGIMQMALQTMPGNFETSKFSIENFEIGNAIIEGDMATVPVKEKQSGESINLTLKKEDGSWKVAFDESALMGTSQQKMKYKQEKQELTDQNNSRDRAKNELLLELNDAIRRIDYLKSSSVKADSILKTKDRDIQDIKNKVQTILNNDNATQAQLAEAKRLIAELKGNIENYTTEIEK